jgi:hypothetical protein
MSEDEIPGAFAMRSESQFDWIRPYEQSVEEVIARLDTDA